MTGFNKSTLVGAMMFALLFLIAAHTNARAQGAGVDGQEFSLDRLNGYIKRSHDTNDKEITSNFGPPTGRWDRKNVLIFKSGTPLLSYVPEQIGQEWGIAFSFSCGRIGTLDITAQLTNLLEPNFGLNVNARHELYIFPYGLGRKYLLPVRVIDRKHSDKVIQVHGTVNTSEPFFKSLRQTSNFQMQLKQNGKFAPYNNGGALKEFDVSLKVLLRHCRGEAPKPSVAGNKADPKAVSTWAPTANEIKGALQRRVDAHLEGLNKAAQTCERIGGSNDPIRALQCLVGAAHKNFGVQQLSVNTVRLDKCVRSKDKIAYCRYDVDADVDLPGHASQFQKILDGALLLPGWVWGSYVLSDERWEHRQTFIDCNVNGDAINCRYR